MTETARLLIEPLQARHAAELYPALADERLYRFLPCQPPGTVEQLEHEFTVRESGIPASEADEQWINFVVRERTTGQLIGRVEATRTGAWAEVAFLFGTDHWGQGFATEAMTGLHHYLSETTRVADCWAAVLPGNDRSMALLQRLGYAKVESGWPTMRSYDPGDTVFHRPLIRSATRPDP